MKTETIVTIAIWVVIYTILILLRKNKHLDFGKEKGWPYHWFIGWVFPILVLIVGYFSGWFTIPQIKLIGFFGVVLMATGKECYDKWIKKTEFSFMDWIITVSAGFTSVFFVLTPILNG